MSRSISMNLSGQEGIFRVDKDVSLFHCHVTVDNVKETLQSVKKELGKMVKGHAVMFTITSFDSESCGDRKSVYRFCFDSWFYNEVLTLEARKFNGYDFSDVQKVHFTTMSQLLNYVIKVTNDQIVSIMDEIPLDKSRFSQSLDEKYPETV